MQVINRNCCQYWIW